MKTIPITLMNSNTRAMFIHVIRADGEQFGFTSCDVKPVILGVQYSEGMEFSAVEQSVDLNANNGEITFIPNDVVIVPDLLTGVWNNCRYVAFEADWVDPQDADIISAGTTGEVRIEDGRYITETRGLKQALRNPQGFTTQATCRARFADYPVPTKEFIRCRIDPNEWIETGTVTTATSRRSLIDSARTEDADWFVYGVFKFLTGENAEFSRVVKAYSSGMFTFDRPFDYVIEVGDTYEVIAGCDKTLTTCRDKFDNVLNFQGEPHTPGADKMTQGAGDAE